MLKVRIIKYLQKAGGPVPRQQVVDKALAAGYGKTAIYDTLEALKSNPQIGQWYGTKTGRYKDKAAPQAWLCYYDMTVQQIEQKLADIAWFDRYTP